MGSCNVNFTLRNYSIKIDNEVAQVKLYNEAESLIREGKVRLTLTGTDLPPAVGLNSSHNLTVTVCHDVVCKTSEPQTLSKFLSHCVDISNEIVRLYTISSYHWVVHVTAKLSPDSGPNMFSFISSNSLLPDFSR